MSAGRHDHCAAPQLRATVEGPVLAEKYMFTLVDMEFGTAAGARRGRPPWSGCTA